MTKSADFTHILMRNNADLEHIKSTIDKNFTKSDDEISRLSVKHDELFLIHYKDKENLIEKINKLETFVTSEIKKANVYHWLIGVLVSAIVSGIIGILFNKS